MQLYCRVKVGRQALHLCLEELGGVLLEDFWALAILKRICDFGSKVRQLNHESHEIEMSEADEMRSYYRLKKLLPDMDCC
jgi:hypothetical protein